MTDASHNRLDRVGEALFGSRWQSDMAEALGVTDRTVRRWTKGATIEAGIWLRLSQLLQERQATLVSLSAEIHAALADE